MNGVTPVKIGDVVKVRDENYQDHNALVVTVFDGGRPETWEVMTPCINVVYTSNDEAKSDSYGRQLERMSSLQHKSQVNMPEGVPGRYWVNI